MITSQKRGHKTKYQDSRWSYIDTGEPISIERPCKKCGKMPTPEGYDACLGKLPGVKSACCGHGIKKGYRIKC